MSNIPKLRDLIYRSEWGEVIMMLDEITCDEEQYVDDALGGSEATLEIAAMGYTRPARWLSRSARTANRSLKEQIMRAREGWIRCDALEAFMHEGKIVPGDRTCFVPCSPIVARVVCAMNAVSIPARGWVPHKTLRPAMVARTAKGVFAYDIVRDD